MRLHVDRRHARVLELLRERGTLRVADLADELGVSPVTLRRDVETLAAQGRLHRLHGAVVWPGDTARTAPGPAETPDGRGGQAQGIVVGMVVPTTEYYYSDVVRGAREAVEARGARLVVALSHYLPGEDSVQVDRLLAAGVDGLLLTPSWETGVPGPGEGQRITERPVPTVLVERSAPHGHPAAALDRVRSDHAHGAAEAVRHLAALGHRTIALAAQESPTSARLRSGYEAAVAALGLRSAPEPSRTPATTEAERFDRTFAYLRDAVEQHGVSAAILHSDADAIVVVPRLRAYGVRVPEDLAVITYDDEVAALADLPLTAVAPAKRAVGRHAAELLLSRLTAPDGCGGPGQHLDILPELRVRESCGAPVSSA
ncbi:substrate-binding domain-containing protein [Streptomyces sp. NPDC050400]|uniref:substrate-binding domain-containing protein n=1 Tax=Streptomyces sp. NPDC050400 TaxID=3365610 RepID=UPI003796CB51